MLYNSSIIRRIILINFYNRIDQKKRVYFIQYLQLIKNMQAKQQLSCVWGVWFSHSSGSKNDVSYGNNLILIAQLQKWADFAYLWKQSLIKAPSNFFADPLTGKYTKYELQGAMRKVDSINFFKYPIQPTWEYGDNASGGYFNFSMSKDTSQQIINKIYEILVFLAIGKALSLSDNLKGIRIVDTSAKNMFRCRFQIWMDYREDDENLEKIKIHLEELMKLFQASEINVNNMKFFNISKKPHLNLQQPQKKVDTQKNGSEKNNE